MGLIDLPYLHSFRDRHGHLRCYYRRGGRRQAISGDPGSPEFLAEYHRIHAQADRPRTNKATRGTFGALVEAYYAAPEFWKNLRESTQIEYKRHIEPMREKWRDVPVIGITKRVIRAYRDSLAEQPRKANQALDALRILLNYAVEIEIIDNNPATRIKPIRIDTEGWKPWPQPALERFSKLASGAPRTAFFLALFTGQRRADVLAMRWDAITPDGGAIVVKQAKKKKEEGALTIPLHPILRVELAKIKAEQTSRTETRRRQKRAAATPLTIVARLDGSAYTEDGFAALWNRAQHATGCAGLPFHGLRKNATNTLMEAGCSTKEAQAITGHNTLMMLEHYAKGANQKRLAESAMAKVVRAEKSKART
ncbi:tyrosine-type recombinase/integrase [Oleispirillum naphthae]|uniref:tyrosine-type recombinase/integrase n=1 Tax=Oleispirillum naphthae TaxID=2838853 RepID=UPI0030823ECF